MISVPDLVWTEANEPLARRKMKGKILIVDDEKTNCDIIYGLLMILGITNRAEISKFAFNGEQAVDEIKRTFDEGNPYLYKLILMDCNMPFMDGYKATQLIRKMFKDSGIEDRR